MAGYVTQKRNLRTLPTYKWESKHPAETYEGETHSPRNGNDDFFRMYVDGYQETTSFRSGSRWDSLNPEQDVLDQAENGNWLQASSALQDPPVRLSHDTGHTFDSVKRTVWLSHTDFTLRSPYPGYGYRGPLLPNRGYMTDIPTTWFRSPQIPDLEGFGRRAIEKTIPTHPSSNLATLLGEARESLPSIPLAQLIRHKGRAANTVGGEYLNVEFGWKPLIRDLQKLAQSVKDSNRILSQYRRDSDRQIRRRLSFPVEETLNSFFEDPFAAFYVPGRDPDGLRGIYFKSRDPSTIPPGYGTFSQSDTTTHRIWFSSAYTYHLEEGSDFLSRMERYEQLANRLLGSRLTAEVVWELSPWSWLADWYGDIGVSISNASALANDGLVLKYGYLMCESTREVHLASTGLDLHQGTLGPVQAKFRTTRKQRIRSTPFGFGQNPADFTGRQWAILAALGLTKAPRTLR